MKTAEQISQEHKSACIDKRDINRLCDFLNKEQIENMGVSFIEGYVHVPLKELTKENVIAQLKIDLAFGFEKALDQRGLSAGAMYEVVKMWSWILEDGLHNQPISYAQYGLPFFKAMALKYGFDNPIGDDLGNEPKYGN